MVIWDRHKTCIVFSKFVSKNAYISTTQDYCKYGYLHKYKCMLILLECVMQRIINIYMLKGLIKTMILNNLKSNETEKK